MKKVLTGIAKAFGWVLLVLSTPWAFSCVICIPISFIIEGMAWSDRISLCLCSLLFTVVFAYLWYVGYCLKSGKKPKAPWAIRFRSQKPAEKATPKPVTKAIPEPDAPESDYLDDITFIKAMTYAAMDPWHQYGVMLDARPYGWDTMKGWADYMAEADLEGISQVEAGTMGAEKQDVTKSFADHGSKCKATPELDMEQGVLSIAGFSKTYGAPMKIVWINQTRTLRLLTTKKDDLLMRKYAETVVRHTFGTENAMKLGKSADSPAEKPAPEKTPEKAPEKPAPEKAPEKTPEKAPEKAAPEKAPEKTPEKAPEKPAAEKPAQEKQAKLNLGNFSFTDAQRQQLWSLPKKGLPERLDAPEAQMALLDVLDAVMDTTVVRMHTASIWNAPEGLPEEKTNRFWVNVAVVIVTVNNFLAILDPYYLRRKVENADFDQLLNAWTVLSYYADVVKPEHTENIRNFRDYIHNALLTCYGGGHGKYLLPAELKGTGIYVHSASLLEWLRVNRLAPQYELTGAMLLTEKEPVITLYEDGVKTREYRLETEKDEDFAGKYFHIGIRMGMQGSPSVPVAQIDGFVSDTPEEREMTLKDVGYRFEGHFLACGGENAKKRQEMNRGQDLPMKALKYVGYTTPSNIRLIGICPDCGKSFCFHGYGFYMAQNDVAYSDDGLDCCQVSAHNIATEEWKCEVEGKTFRYYNSFCCPHCGTPYIDYRKHPENKNFGVSGCVHLGRKVYNDTDASTETR